MQFSFGQLRRHNEIEDRQETKAILEFVTDRFKRYLELPYMLGLLGAQYLQTNSGNIGGDEVYSKIIVETNPEILGLNFVDDKGIILRTYPEKTNSAARGRRSQNFGQILDSYERNEPYYLSAPFRLYQGQQGFIFYVPVVRQKKLSGWYAIVISSERFLEKFALQDFLRLFDLVIIDEESGRDFFATSMEPRDPATRIFEKDMKLFGRKLIFRTWHKKPHTLEDFPWYFSVIVALILAAASAFILGLYEQRKKARGQLDNMSILLRVTSKEALTNLIEIHSEFNQLNLPEDESVERLSRDINYLTNLIEQIDLLQTMAHNREGLTEGEHSFLQLFEDQVETFSEVLDRKNLRVNYSKTDFQNIRLKVNDWLFGNSVLSNVLSHLMIHAEPGSEIRIASHTRSNRLAIVFSVKKLAAADHSSKIVTRRIEVARKVLQLQQGDLREEYSGPDELIITLFLPQ